MDLNPLQQALAHLPLGEIRFVESAGSTNDLAAKWAEAGAPHLSLILAEEQTAGRGRGGRRWFTPPKSALALSLILRPAGQFKREDLPQFTVLGALAVSDALANLGVETKIKWPNDVLVKGRKIAGVLAEATWLGDQLGAVILGIGINITPASLPSPATLDLPATCVEHAAGRGVDRLALLKDVLSAILSWRRQVGKPALIEAWSARLAYLAQEVTIDGDAGQFQGRITGLTSEGWLIVQAQNGEARNFRVGEVHLRPS